MAPTTGPSASRTLPSSEAAKPASGRAATIANVMATVTAERSRMDMGGTPGAQHTARARACFALVLAGVFGLACASDGPAPRNVPAVAEVSPALLAEAEALAATLSEAPPPAEDALRVRLAFGEAFDLDLFVSDPLQETVYFANERAQSGGVLREDQRCGSPAPRIEVVEWAAPPPGRYRVGIDFPSRCAKGGPRQAPYAVAIERGGRRTLLRGVAELGVFVPIVDRFDHRP